MSDIEALRRSFVDKWGVVAMMAFASIVAESEAPLLARVAMLEEALSGMLTAINYTYTVVPADGDPHWCREFAVLGRHDATCGGMLMYIAAARAAMAKP